MGLGLVIGIRFVLSIYLLVLITNELINLFMLRVQ